MEGAPTVAAATAAPGLIKVLSAGLAYFIVVGSSILKVPQLFNIVKSCSADGVSLTSQLMEAAGYSILASWGIARGMDFKDYGEALVITAQLAMLIVLVGVFQRRMGTVLLVYGPTVALGLCLATGMVHKDVHEMLLSTQILLGLAARVPQIYSNYKRQNTGELAFLTFFLALGGCGARFLTTLVNVPMEKGKVMIMLQFFVAGVLNFIIVAQIILYMYTKGGRVVFGRYRSPQFLPTRYGQRSENGV